MTQAATIIPKPKPRPRGAPPKPIEDKKEYALQIRVTIEEYAEFKLLAKKKRTSVSKLCRAVILPLIPNCRKTVFSKDR